VDTFLHGEDNLSAQSKNSILITNEEHINEEEMNFFLKILMMNFG